MKRHHWKVKEYDDGHIVIDWDGKIVMAVTNFNRRHLDRIVRYHNESIELLKSELVGVCNK